MTFSPFLCLNEEIMQCFFVNGAKIVFNSFRYNKSLKPKKERNGNETEKSCLHSPLPGKGFVILGRAHIGGAAAENQRFVSACFQIDAVHFKLLWR